MAEEELTKVDSAIGGLNLDEKPKPTAITDQDVNKHHHHNHKRVTPEVEGVWNIKDLGKYPSYWHCK